MLDFLTHLFDTKDFPPRWNCGNWSAGHGWLHILSDLGIWSAYFAIPVLLVSFASKRPDVPFRRVFLLFGSFILACGTTHLLEAVIFWKPVYRFAGVVKLGTAVVSWATIVALVRVIPEALRLKGPEQLEAEVRRRTTELAQANSDLHQEMVRREQIAEELRRVAADLSDANRRKSEFLAILAHELRNPLAPLRNSVEILRFSETEPDIIREVVATLDRQTGQMVHLVDDLLDVSRITQGKLQLRLQLVNLAEILATAIESTEPLVRQAGHRLVVGDLSQTIHLNADPTRLTQVFVNLLNNAVKYTPAPGVIKIALQAGEDDVTIHISDSGVGIPAEMQNRIFDLFTQLEPRQGRVTAGLGIGLTLVQRLVELHHGRVEVHSAGENQGSTFSVHLPRLRHQADDASGNSAASLPTPGRRVLIVDDNSDAARSLELMLGMWGHEVRTAANGLEAVDVAGRFRPEIVFMDLGMPVLNGFEAARRIRAEPWGRDMSLVALSGWGQETDRERARDSGFNHHLVKPGSPVQFQELLSRLPTNGAGTAAR